MQNLLKTILFTPGAKGRWGLPALFEGAPGTAKSAVLERLAAQTGLHCETVIAGLRAPEDFLGLPIPVQDEVEEAEVAGWLLDGAPRAEVKRAGKGKARAVTLTSVSYAPPRWALNLARAGRGVCFLDEVKTAPPAVQAALLRVVLEGVVGDLRLPDTVRFLAACNATEDTAGGWDLASPLANRFGHFDWSAPGVDDWAGYMVGGGDSGEASGDARAEEERVLAEWHNHYPAACGLVVGFLRARPQHQNAQPKSGDPAASKAWPSWRTNEMAVRALASARLHGLPEEEHYDLVGGYVGQGYAIELRAYAKEADLPDPAALLDGRARWEHQPIRIDRTAAVLGACAALVRSSSERQRERAARLWKLMRPVAADAADVCVPAAQALVTKRLGVGSDDSIEVLDKCFPVSDALRGVK